jgi:phosphoribosylglycinamide formyltransferase 1
VQRADDYLGDGLARVAVLISGSGRTLENLVERTVDPTMGYRIVHVVSTRFGIRGNDVARATGTPLTIAPRRHFASDQAFSSAVVDVLDRESVDLVVCGGFLSKLVVPDRYLGRIVNIHPSLLPLFGGKGYYGDRVHKAVIDSGMQVSGCTVHFVNNDYDSGPIIAQECVPVEPGDTVETLAQRVFAVEKRMYPSVVRDVARGRIRLEGDQVHFGCRSST